MHKTSSMYSTFRTTPSTAHIELHKVSKNVSFIVFIGIYNNFFKIYSPVDHGCVHFQLDLQR